MRLVELNRKENHYEDYTHERRDESYTSIPDFYLLFFYFFKTRIVVQRIFICYFFYFVLILYLTLSGFSSAPNVLPPIPRHVRNGGFSIAYPL